MRDPKVEEFLAHTRLAAEGDAKQDFERRVDRKVEEAKYSADEPRDEHGRWGDGGGGVPGTMSRNGQIDHELDRSHSHWTQATSPAASELEKAGFRHALSDQPRAQTGVRAYDRGYDVGLGYKYPVTEGQRAINMQRFGSEKLPKLDTRTPAVALVSAPPHTRIGLRDAPVGETKYSEDQPRGDDGRWGSGGLAADLKDIHETALAKAKEIGHQPGGRVRFKKGTVKERVALRGNAAYHAAFTGYHQATVEELAAKGWTIDMIRAAQRDSPTLTLLSSRLPTAARPFAGVTNRLAKSAPTIETKYSDDQPRDDHGRFGVTGTDYEGEDANSSHITRVETGYLPVSAVASLRGAKGEVPGEHRHKQGAAWDSFKTDISRNGMRDPIFITKDWNKSAVISEGNHRRDAAIELGNINIPVEIRYFGNAQKQGLVR